MTEYLFNAPWWLPLGIAVAGAAVFVSGNRRQEKRTQFAGVGIVIAAALVAILSYFVQTPVEKCLNRTVRLVTALEERDWATFESLLHPQTSFYSYNSREELVAAARKSVDQFGLKSIGITSREAQQTQTVITVDLGLVTTLEYAMFTGSFRSNWRFEWQLRGDQWLLYRIEPLPGGDLSSDEVERNLPKVPQTSEGGKKG